MKKRSSWKKSEALFSVTGLGCNARGRGQRNTSFGKSIVSCHLDRRERSPEHQGISPFGRDDMCSLYILRFRVEMNLYFFLRPTKPSRARPELNRTMGKGNGTGAR